VHFAVQRCAGECAYNGNYPPVSSADAAQAMHAENLLIGTTM